MMKLYMRQKVFSWGDKFTVKDEYGQDRYYVEGEIFSWGKKLHVYDCSGSEVAFISQKVWSFLPKYCVFVDGREVAQIVKEFTFLFPKYRIDGLGWEVNGSFMAHDYEITRRDVPIVTIHKEWMTWGDCYALDIADPADEIIALSVVLAIDCVLESSSGASVTVSSN